MNFFYEVKKNSPNSMDKEFKRLTKDYARNILELIRSNKKREAEADPVPEASEVSEVAEPVLVAIPAPTAPAATQPKKKKKKTTTVVDDGNWTCAGMVWLSPTVPCAGNTEKSKIKNGILYNGQKVVVCRECFLARERKKNQEKRDRKKGTKINQN